MIVSGESRMKNKKDIISVKGEILEVLPNATFRVLVGEEREILAYTSGKMRKNRIRILVGDKVDLEMSPYDTTRGRVVFRHK